MRNAIAIIAGLITIAGTLPYIIDTAKGKTHPNIVTWLTWTLVNLINTAAALSTGALQTALFGGFSALSTGTIAVMGVKRGVKRYTPFDIGCQVFAVIGIIIWKLTNQPDLAIIIALIVDYAAVLPTWRHAWLAPFAETWQGFAIGGSSAVLTLFAIAHFNFVSLAFPVAIAASNMVTVGIILIRRRQAPQLKDVVV